MFDDGCIHFLPGADKFPSRHHVGGAYSSDDGTVELSRTGRASSDHKRTQFSKSYIHQRKHCQAVVKPVVITFHQPESKQMSPLLNCLSTTTIGNTMSVPPTSTSNISDRKNQQVLPPLVKSPEGQSVREDQQQGQSSVCNIIILSLLSYLYFSLSPTITTLSLLLLPPLFPTSFTLSLILPSPLSLLPSPHSLLLPPHSLLPPPHYLSSSTSTLLLHLSYFHLSLSYLSFPTLHLSHYPTLTTLSTLYLCLLPSTSLSLLPLPHPNSPTPPPLFLPYLHLSFSLLHPPLSFSPPLLSSPSFPTAPPPYLPLSLFHHFSIPFSFQASLPAEKYGLSAKIYQSPSFSLKHTTSGFYSYLCRNSRGSLYAEHSEV